MFGLSVSMVGIASEIPIILVSPACEPTAVSRQMVGVLSMLSVHISLTLSLYVVAS